MFDYQSEGILNDGGEILISNQFSWCDLNKKLIVIWLLNGLIKFILYLIESHRHILFQIVMGKQFLKAEDLKQTLVILIDAIWAG